MGFFSNAKRIYNAGKIARDNQELDFIKNSNSYSEEEKKKMLKLAQKTACREEQNKILAEASEKKKK